jgi:hypothetical protein
MEILKLYNTIFIENKIIEDSEISDILILLQESDTDIEKIVLSGRKCKISIVFKFFNRKKKKKNLFV